MGNVVGNAEFLMLIFVILVQCASGIWWASNINARIRTLESNHSGFDRDQRATDTAVQEMKVTMALLNQSFSSVTKALERMDGRLAGIEKHLSNDQRV